MATLYLYRAARAAVTLILYPFVLCYRMIELAFFDVRPDARTTLAIGRRAVEAVDMQPSLSRFRAFLERAPRHANFTADHFDPGRSPA